VTIEVPDANVKIVLQEGNPVPVIINAQQQNTTDLILYNESGIEVK